jgi:hypothetical protein
MSPFIQVDQVSSIYDTMQKELQPTLPRLESTLADTLSQEQCSKLSGFLKTSQTPFVFLEKDPVWSSEQVSERLTGMILSLAKFPLDMRDASLFLQGVAEHAEYLYAFNRGDTKEQIKASLVLAFAGVACHTIALSDMWRLAGFSRFATEYARASSILEDADLRERITTIVDLATENDVPILQPIAGIYEKATGKVTEYPHESHFRMTDEQYFAQVNLDYPGLDDVKRAIDSGDIEGASRAYVKYLVQSCALPPEYFSPWPFDVVDTSEADEICQNILFLRAHNALKHDYGEEVDWTTVLNNDIETNVSINGHAHLSSLATAYKRTGDEKYTHHIARLWDSWYAQSPCPDVRKSLQWRTLECGVRASIRWPWICNYGIKSQEFRDKILSNMAKSYLEHARYLSTHQAGGGNWFQVETSGLGAAAVMFPEWKESERFFQLALRRLRWGNDRTFFPDGFQTEGSCHYHSFPYWTMGNFYALAHVKGRQLPQEFIDEFERTTEPFVYLTQPDYNMPLLNDCDPSYNSASRFIIIAAEMFQREDFKYVKTSGKEGAQPKQASYAFPYAGYYVMRDGWDISSPYLMFDAGYFGSGHQHEDKLNFVLYAYGQPLIIDPGIHRYVRDAFEQYFRSSRGHNSIMVDGKGQRRGLHLRKEQIPDPETRWISQKEFDFVQGWYRDGFSTRSQREKDMEDLERDIHHRRSIFHPRGGYYIVRDFITGNGLREIEQIFHIAPIITSPEVEPGNVKILENGVVQTDNPERANVAIVPVQPGDITDIRDVCGQTEPYAVGWTALYGRQPSHDAAYVRRAALPVSFDVVLIPLRPGEGDIPVVTEAAVESDVPATAFIAEGTDFANLFLMSDDGPVQMKTADVAFFGELLYMRLSPQRELQIAVIINGKTLEFAGKQFLSLLDVVESRVVTIGN